MITVHIIDKNVLSILDLSLDGIFIENLKGDILMCNQSGADMFGYTIEEMTTLNIRDLVPDSNNYYLKEIYSKEDLFPQEYIDRINVKKDGTLIRTEINSKIITSGDIEYLIAFVRNANLVSNLDPNDPQRQKVLSSIEKIIEKERQILLTLEDSVGNEKYVIPLSSVMYIEGVQKKIKVYFINGTTISGYGRISEIEQQIGAKGSFLRCYHSYIINMQWASIHHENKVFVMKNGNLVPMRTRYYSKYKKAYEEYQKAIECIKAV